MFRLFRRQHVDKFLTSFDKLGLSGLPDAVACAQYHVLSNNVGGVGVEYMYESDQKACALSLPALDILWANYLWRAAGRQSWFLKRLVRAQWCFFKQSAAWFCLRLRGHDRGVWLMWLF